MTASPPQTDQPAAAGSRSIEIERKYLLRGVPQLPNGTMTYRIEQGYLPGRASAESAGNAEMVQGRVRRRIGPDGAAMHWHTVKRGAGERRTEIERAITAEQFAAAWPATIGRRIIKTRSLVPDRIGAIDAVWEIDVFRELDLVLAEVELPEAGMTVVLPDWLSEYVVRDVTDERGYTNYALATRGLPR
jgi:CYTH domain-containing protein